MPSVPPVSCHVFFRSQVEVCIDWVIVPLEENKYVILSALSFSALSLFSLFVANILLIVLIKATPQETVRCLLPTGFSRGSLCSWAKNGSHRGFPGVNHGWV